MTPHFFGTLKGRSGTVTSREGAKSGITSELHGAGGYITCRLFHENKTDMVEITHWSLPGATTTLYRGPLFRNLLPETKTKGD